MSLSFSSSRLSSIASVAAVALACSAAGCSKEKAESAAFARAADAPSVAAAVAPASEDSAPSPVSATGARPLAATRALVVTLDMSVVVKNPDAVATRVREDVERAGGYVADASTSGSGELRSTRLDLRVPAERTKSLRAMLADAGEIVQDNEKSEDVTEQRADLEARLRNARAQEKRTLEIMAQRTGSLGELLEVERELARVRETVERFEAQKRALDGKVDLTTVHLTVSAKHEPVAVAEPGALAKIQQAAVGGVHATGTILLYAAMVLAASAPVLVPFGLFAAAAAFVVRRRRRVQEAALRAVPDAG